MFSTVQRTVRCRIYTPDSDVNASGEVAFRQRHSTFHSSFHRLNLSSLNCIHFFMSINKGKVVSVHDMKAYGSVELQLHSSFISAPDGGE